MSTKIHVDEVKTVVHTSQWAVRRQADFLRRISDATTADYFLSSTAAAEAAAHQREHDRIVYCQSIGLPA